MCKQNQINVFKKEPVVRNKRRVMMHAIDHGSDAAGDDGTHFICPKCNHDDDWHFFDSPATQAEMTVAPCPICNKKKDK